MKFASNLNLPILVASLSLFSNSYAAEREDVIKHNNVSDNAAPQKLHQRLQLNQNELEALRSVSYDNGRVVIRYQQLYKGVPLWGERVIEHVDPGTSQSLLMGKVIRKLDIDLDNKKPNLSADEALQLAKAKAGVYASNNDQVKLWITLDEQNIGHFVYHVTFATSNGGLPSSPYFVIDASTGTVLQQWENNKYAFPVVAVSGAGGGNPNISYSFGANTSYGPLWVEKIDSINCRLKNSNVMTVTYNSDYNNPTKFNPIADTPPPSFACNGGNTAKTTNNVHYFGQRVFDMYQAYGVQAFSNSVAQSQGYSALVLAYDNTIGFRASWQAGKSGAYFGGGGAYPYDGDPASSFQSYPWVSADIIAHEISHGFTQQHANLSYEQEPRALNEAFSDMAGEAFKYFINGSNDFLFGSEAMVNGGAIRSLSDPKPVANKSQYDTWFATHLPEEHVAAGIFDKAFYLLAQKPGWGVGKAFQLMVDANNLYWTQTTGFSSAACDIHQAAINRGYSTADVDNAFDQVGYACQPVCPLSISVDGGATFGTSKTLRSYGQIMFRFDTGYATRNNSAYWYGSKDIVQAGFGYPVAPSAAQDATGQPIGTVPNTYTYQNTPGAEGLYTRNAVIRDNHGIDACRTNNVQVKFMPPLACQLTVNNKVDTAIVNKGQNFTFAVTINGSYLPPNTQGDWIGYKNNITDADYSTHKQIVGSVLWANSYTYTNPGGSASGNYSRAMELRVNDDLICTTNAVNLTLLDY